MAQGPGKGYLLLNCGVATLGGFLFGYDTAVIAGTTEFLQRKFALTEMQLGWAVSSAIVGCVLGAAMSGWTSDRWGRKKVLIASALFFLISSIGTALPQSLHELAFYRLVGGIGVGCASILTPLYIAELAPARIRGALISFNQVMILAGMIIVYVVNAAIVRHGSDAWLVETGWRWMFGSEAVPSLLFLALLLFIPESPRWLVKAGRDADALAVLNRLDMSAGAGILAEIKGALALESGGWGELWRFRRALLVGVGLAFIQHGTGINVIMYYGPRIFTSAGIATNDAFGHSIIIAVCMAVFTITALFLVDRFGRRPLVLISTAGMGLCLFALGFVFKEEVSPAESRLLLASVLGYVAFFSIGMGPVIWVVIAEIFPTGVRGRAASIAVFWMWTASLLISQFFPWQLATMRGGVFHFYGIVCVLALIFVAWLQPESRNRTLEEIEKLWLGAGEKKTGS